MKNYLVDSFIFCFFVVSIRRYDIPPESESILQRGTLSAFRPSNMPYIFLLKYLKINLVDSFIMLTFVT
jgi:hypothetical protein